MKQFHELCQSVLDHGQFKPDRTGTGTVSAIGRSITYQLSPAFEPAITTKKLAFKAVKGELLGFFRGYDSAAQFRALGCGVWDKNANEDNPVSPNAWLRNPNRKGVDHLGAIYGVQWTRWRDTKLARTPAEDERYRSRGYELVARDDARGVSVWERTINQLEEALRALIKDPYSRRVIVSGWRVDDLDAMALPPCHVAYWWGVMPDGKLHGTLWIRSNDLFLGHPFNAASMGIFTAIMARLSGHEPGSVTIFISDAHIYKDHLEQTKELLSREAFEPPQLWLSDNIRRITDEADIKGAFERIEPSDIELLGYTSHGAIKANMAV